MPTLESLSLKEVNKMGDFLRDLQALCRKYEMRIFGAAVGHNKDAPFMKEISMAEGAATITGSVAFDGAKLKLRVAGRLPITVIDSRGRPPLRIPLDQLK